MTSVYTSIRQTNPAKQALIALIALVTLAIVVTLPGWLAAGIGGMQIFIKTICIFWIVAIVVVALGALWIALDPHSN